MFMQPNKTKHSNLQVITFPNHQIQLNHLALLHSALTAYGNASMEKATEVRAWLDTDEAQQIADEPEVSSSTLVARLY